MTELPRKVAVGFASLVIVGVLGVFFKEPLVDWIVEGLRGLPGFLAPAGDWVEAHRVEFVVGTTAAGGVLAFTVAKLLRAWEGLGLILLGGGLLGFLAGESVLEWMNGSVANGPVTLAGVGVLALVWLVVGIRSAASWRRLQANESRARRLVVDDLSRYRLPPVRIEPHGLPSRDRLSAARAASYSASFLSQSRPGPRRGMPPTD